MSRIDHILQMIEDYSSDSHMDGYHRGYDEAWDEARDKGFDEGFEMGREKAYEDVLEMIDTTPWVMTPESRDECGSMIESFHDNGHMCAMMLMNYLAAQIESMKE